MAEVHSLPARAVSVAARIRLATFLSPAFPVGGFSYSHGLEWAIDAGRVRDGATLSAWIGDLLCRGSFWCDAVLLRCAFAAMEEGDTAAVVEIGALAESLAASAERHLETMAMGEAFLAAARTAWPGEMPDGLLDATGGRLAYPVAVGAIAATNDVALTDALPVYLNAMAANLISVAVRLVPLGQSEGLRVLAELEPAIATAASRALRASADDLGSATVQSDIAAMRHEAQYSRVFRT